MKAKRGLEKKEKGNGSATPNLKQILVTLDKIDRSGVKVKKHLQSPRESLRGHGTNVSARKHQMTVPRPRQRRQIDDASVGAARVEISLVDRKLTRVSII